MPSKRGISFSHSNGNGHEPNESAPLSDSGQKKPIGILIADGQTIFRDALRALLGRVRGFRIVGEAADGESAIKQVQQLKPDVLLLDLMLPKTNGIDVLRELSATGFPARVLVFSSDVGANETVRAINMGAQGVMLKSSSSPTLFEGIRRVMAGEYWIAPDSVARLMERLQRPPARVAPAQTTQFGLTGRELEVVMEVVSGFSNQEIANKLFLSRQTVKHHLTHIFDKLGVYSRVELALFAVSHNLGGAQKCAGE